MQWSSPPPASKYCLHESKQVVIAKVLTVQGALQAELPQLESHIIHHVPLAQHAVRWHQVTAVSLTIQVGMLVGLWVWVLLMALS